MFKYFYASTKDRKGNTHNYKLTSGETVPINHEIVDLSVASRFKLSEMLSDEAIDTLNAFVGRKPRNAEKK